MVGRIMPWLHSLLVYNLLRSKKRTVVLWQSVFLCILGSFPVFTLGSYLLLLNLTLSHICVLVGQGEMIQPVQLLQL